MSDERDLDWQLRRLRIASKDRRSSGAAREALFTRFDAKHSGRRNVWIWPASVAAAVALAVAVTRAPHQPVANLPAVAEESAEASAGFIAVPFVPPLAPGELVHVVHTELHPAALAGLGVNVDPSWATAMPADLLVGQDGFPRAVRVSNEDSGDF